MNQPCTIKGHEITRSFSEAKDGKAEVHCLCWDCDPILSWVELWKFDRVVEDNEPPLK